MSVLTLIHQEAETTLSGDLQKKVVAYIELLKFNIAQICENQCASRRRVCVIRAPILRKRPS